MSDELLELASRVEAASGPDRELDAAAWWLCIGKHDKTDPDLLPRFEADPAKALDYWCGPQWRTEQTWPFPPRYSTSLDAAMMLVPDGFGFMIDGAGTTWFADLDAAQEMQGEAQSPALALTAACLRARASRLRMEVE